MEVAAIYVGPRSDEDQRGISVYALTCSCASLSVEKEKTDGGSGHICRAGE